ncbi:hypothetical protein SUGI_1116920 [Cryptomeria japonica]|uniref:probable UDP-glucosyl transferase 73B6 n=1 Tax=Cryptomeria japonica TaxID=3369 RepID=UPI002414B60C|nr:probable UDP-glucosyl transferase 73B6 [Cryptomeria japonica]GLJ52492.1 hypothetical protein SUGI_1116920 [Cryptomeria japonica]
MWNKMNGCEKSSKPHVVVIPYVGQGHLIPFLELTKLLASHGLIVSYISTPGNVARLQPQVDHVVKSSNPGVDIRLVSLPMPPVEDLPPGIESSETVPLHMIGILMKSSYKLAGQFEQWLEQEMKNAEDQIHNSPSPPVCIISDMFTSWVHKSGAKFGLPTVVFHTSGAFAMSVMHSFMKNTPQKNVQGDDEYFQVPNLPLDFKLRKSELPFIMRDSDANPMQSFVTDEINLSMEGSGVIFNTFYALDSLGIEHIKSLTKKPVWSIGPILPKKLFDAEGVERATHDSRGKSADISEAECLQWLDKRSPNSVVFVCFGSQSSLNKQQTEALAKGLEASQQAFIWAIKRVPEIQLPEGFEERIKDRGLIIWGWAPQLLILSHPSTGAFLSHCGWNSTLESISLGVPMITWPMYAEQPFNNKLLVEHLGIAEQICSHMDGVGDEYVVKRAVIKVLAEEEGEMMRSRAQELRKKAKMAVEKDGFSHANLQAFREYVQERHDNWVLTAQLSPK